MSSSSFSSVLKLFVLLVCLMPVLALAQDETQETLRFSRLMVPVDPVTLKTEGVEIRLWGVNPASASETHLEIRALERMQRMIGNKEVSCKIMDAANMARPTARCSTAANQDIAIALLQEGLLVRDRRALYGSVFASSYEEAENTAKENRAGIWGLALSPDKSPIEKLLEDEKRLALAAFLIVLLPVLAMIVLGMIIRSGLKKLMQYQVEENNRQREKEGTLHKREKTLLLNAIETELKENKAKVEAFLTVYMEMLSNIKDPNETPKYQHSGDVISLQPNFIRHAFDANIALLSSLDMKLAGELTRVYQNIKPEPDYIDLNSSTPREEAIGIVERVVAEGREYLPLLDQTIDLVRAHQTPTEDLL